MKAWKKVIVICATAVLAAVVLVCVYLEDLDCMDTIRLTADAADGVTQSLCLYEDEGTYYAFLPAFADANAVRIDYAAGYDLYLDDMLCAAGSTVRLSPGQSHTLRMRGAFGFSPRKQTLVVMQAKNVPALSIRLTDGTLKDIHADKEVSKTGVASLVLADRTIDFSGSFKKLHGRGNTSWAQAKKSYALLFQDAVDLLGMGAGRSWVLISNVFDVSGLRNKLVYDTAKAIGVRYAVDCEYVDLYIDGAYLGLYLLAERVEVGEGHVEITDLSVQTQNANYSSLSSYTRTDVTYNGLRQRYLDIPNDPADITGGYLVQIDHNKTQLAVEDSYFQTPGLTFMFSSPQYGSRRQVEYLSDLFNRTQTALAAGDLSSIDLDSFVKYYLIQEFFANTDESSMFFCKDSDRIDPKIYACAIWDFDMSMGNMLRATDLSCCVLCRNGNNWFDLLYRNPAFFAALRAQYSQSIRQDVQSLLYDRLNDYAQKIERSFLMNKCRWRRLYEPDAGTALTRSQVLFDTVGEHVQYISQYLRKRIAYLDSVWVLCEGEASHLLRFTFRGTKSFVRWVIVKDGVALGKAPDPQDPLFAEWFDTDGNAYDPDQIALQNKSYVGRAKTSDAPAAPQSSLRLVSSLASRLLLSLTHSSRLAAAGLCVIGFAIGAFLVADGVRMIRKRRCRHDRRQ